jgi:LysM repeat protein
MDLRINISLNQNLKPRNAIDRNISYSDSRNLPLPSGSKHSEYVVKNGETLQMLAEMCGVTPVQMAEWLRDQYGNDMIYAGQTIKLPTKIEAV